MERFRSVFLVLALGMGLLAMPLRASHDLCVRWLLSSDEDVPFEVVHGTLPEDPFSSVASLLLPFVRDAYHCAYCHEDYLANVVLAKRDFENWFETWLAGVNFTREDWFRSLKQRHLVATGKATRTPHPGPGNEYRSTSWYRVWPGHFRSERLWKNGGPFQTHPIASVHVKRWLKHWAYPAGRAVTGRNTEVRGLDELLQSQGRELITASTDTVGSLDCILYPHDADVDVFLELGWQRLGDVKRAILNYLESPSQENQGDALNAVADYYQTVITGHYFFKINNSMLMPEVNVFLRKIGYHPIMHGSLDLIAIRMDYLPFRHYFREFVERLQPHPVTAETPR